MNNTKKGKAAEEFAIAFLQKNNFVVDEVNWQNHKAEIDIIAYENGKLVFVEVKSRRSSTFGDPTIAVTLKKQRLLVSAANQYMDIVGYNGDFRFDIITIVGEKPDQWTIEHYKDAFFPGLDFYG